MTTERRDETKEKGIRPLEVVSSVTRRDPLKLRRSKGIESVWCGMKRN